jgi:Ca2+-binding EF-hand superfamily protein
VKQLEQLKYLAPQVAIDNLTGDTADSLAILKQAYTTFDIDGDGIITDTEVKTLLKGLGVNVSQESLSDLFSRFDKDGNNALDFNEFIMMMRSMKQARQTIRICANMKAMLLSVLPLTY